MIRRTVAAATASLAVALAGGAPAFAAPGAPDAEGADLVALSVESGELRMGFRGSGPAATDPQSLRFTASGSPIGVVPDDPAFAFLGRPGTPVWSLQEGSPFSTFDTTAIGAGAVTDGAVTLELVSVDGPGTFAAYTVSAWGRPTLLLDSDGQTSTRLPAGQRLGGVVWLFDAVGEYRVTLRATARAGSRTLRDEAVYLVTVPAGDPAGQPAGQQPAAQPAADQPAPGQPAADQPAADQPAAQAAPQSANQAARQAPAATAAAGGATAEAGAARAAAAGTTAPAAAGRRVISDGHVDMGPQLDGGALRIRLKDDSTTPPTWRETADVTLKVTDKARIDVPSGADYAFLGKAGEKVYLLPESQQAGIVWPGWNTQHESLVKGTRGNVVWRLKQVGGPGEFKLFLTGPFGTPKVIFDSAKTLPQQLGIAPNTHAHGNWAFTKAGTYQLSVEMTATTTAGRSVSDTRTLTIAVGDSTDAGSGGDSGNGNSGNTGGTGTGGTGNGGSGTGSGSGAGPNDGGSGSGSNDGGGGNLARTGVDVVSIAGGGTLLLAVGAAAVVLARRRQSEPGHVSTPDPSL